MKKYFIIGVIILFIGLAVEPSINANMKKEDLVEFTTEVCGFNGKKQTIKLTQEEAYEVEALFDSIRTRLNDIDSREEAKEIFKEAVVELDKYGLLGGLSVEKTKRLVTGGYYTKKGYKLIEKLSISKQEIWENDSNCFCLTCGRTDITYFLGMILPRVRFLTPTPVMNRMFYGSIQEDLYGYTDFYPSNGWIFTFGLKGIKIWNGSFWGNLSIYSIFPFYCDLHWLFFSIFIFGFSPDFPLGGTRYPGVSSFSGIKILYDDGYYFYLGFALRVGLTYETPEYS